MKTNAELEDDASGYRQERERAELAAAVVKALQPRPVAVDEHTRNWHERMNRHYAQKKRLPGAGK